MMNKEEAKQYIRIQINSCIKTQNKHPKYYYELCYNKQYLRVLKLSKITNQPINKENFKGWVTLFTVDPISKRFWYFDKIRDYLNDNYSNDCFERLKLVEEVFNEYEEYKDYKIG